MMLVYDKNPFTELVSIKVFIEEEINSMLNLE